MKELWTDPRLYAATSGAARRWAEKRDKRAAMARLKSMLGLPPPARGQDSVILDVKAE